MEFKLPDIGEGVAEGEITKWLVKPGDPIKVDQPMVEVMTDKATVEIPSPINGTVSELLAKEGETVPVGKVIVKIGEKTNGKGGSPTQAAPKAESQAPRETPSQREEPAREERQPAAKAGAGKREEPREREVEREPRREADVVPFKVLATPATRKLARDLGVDIAEIRGTGPSGRVTKADVQMAYESTQAAAVRPSHPVPVGREPQARPGKMPAPYVASGAVERVPLRGIRKKIAEGMTRSKHTAAHFTYVEEVDMSEIVRMRAQAKDEAAARGVKLTYLPFIIKAVIPALREFPYMNSSLDDEKQEIVLKGDYNIGIAIDTPNGLMVPVVKQADRKSIWDLAIEIEDLSQKARSGKIAMEDLKGGTFTLTNAGSIGGVFATPVINHPEVAILGVNSIRKRPVVKNDQIAIADMMFLSLSVDHRVVDGADAARFMNRLIYFLSDPKRFVFA